jgi:hypothetical protein
MARSKLGRVGELQLDQPRRADRLHVPEARMALDEILHAETPGPARIDEAPLERAGGKLASVRQKPAKPAPVPGREPHEEAL